MLLRASQLQGIRSSWLAQMRFLVNLNFMSGERKTLALTNVTHGFFQIGISEPLSYGWCGSYLHAFMFGVLPRTNSLYALCEFNSDVPYHYSISGWTICLSSTSLQCQFGSIIVQANNLLTLGTHSIQMIDFWTTPPITRISILNGFSRHIMGVESSAPARAPVTPVNWDLGLVWETMH